MARAPTLRQRINALIDELEPVTRKAFEESIQDITSQIVLTRVVERLERGDISGAVEALLIEDAAFRPLERAVAQAYDAGGSATVIGMPKLRDRGGAEVVFRFDARNVRAERWVRDHSANLVRSITDDMKAGARTAMEDGMARGAGPRTIALEIAGRTNRATGRREGGIIGLSTPQQDYVASMRSRLLSGDPEEMRKVLSMERRDKRFDRAIMKAIDAGKPLDAETIQRSTARYADRLIQLRAETIARVETGQAIHASKYEAFTQGLEKTGYTEAAVTRRWRSAGDGRVRHTHSAMNGQTVKGLRTPFVSPSGARMLHPLDTSLGAGPHEIIGCRCDDEINIDYSEGLT